MRQFQLVDIVLIYGGWIVNKHNGGMKLERWAVTDLQP